MAKAHKPGALLRERVEHQHARVSYVELFFDLVFVFAITQISHTLLAHFSILGLAEAGATAVIQPGGSMRDDEVIKAADEAGLAMVFTGHRHFRH